MVSLIIFFPLTVYQDDSSDELSDVLDDLLLPASDNEDAWDLDGDEVENDDTDEDEQEDKSEEDGDDDDEDEDDDDSDMEQDGEQVMVNGINGDEDMDSE